MPFLDPIRRREYHRDYMRDHPQVLTRPQKDHRNARVRATYDPLYKRRNHLWKRYGMTLEDYAARLASQGGHCKFCKTTIEKNGKPLAVDHDKVTGEVRGILCHRHNQALGTFGDDEAGLAEALAYVRGEL